ncbi:MAG TPA: hypothetical protein DEB09_04925 [Candidatus Magasanikbacteria bacterium]|nr:hypothetical protein [Candidatus Magasanikbacteria bacterium]
MGLWLKTFLTTPLPRADIGERGNDERTNFNERILLHQQRMYMVFSRITQGQKVLPKMWFSG